MKTHLDFFIIGAQKSGTTTLYKHLSQHPNVYMPTSKEAPFFHDKDVYNQGWAWYVDEYFRGAATEKQWGTATPQYMYHQGTPNRIYQQCPDAKLIAILRSPIDRVFSHYKMNIKRQRELRPLEALVDQLLQPDELELARAHPTETNSYIIWGEYGRILQHYLEVFPKQQLLILFTKDLAERPKEVMMRIYQFLGLKEIYPNGIGKKFHQGGLKRKLPDFRKRVKNSPLIKLWHLLPQRQRIPLRYWFEQWNTIKDEVAVEAYAPEVVRKIKQHYIHDTQTLNKLFNTKAPWSDSLYQPDTNLASQLLETTQEYKPS